MEVKSVSRSINKQKCGGVTIGGESALEVQLEVKSVSRSMNKRKCGEVTIGGEIALEVQMEVKSVFRSINKRKCVVDVIEESNCIKMYEMQWVMWCGVVRQDANFFLVMNVKF